jgi:hypothetical protein
MKFGIRISATTIEGGAINAPRSIARLDEQWQSTFGPVGPRISRE